MKNKKISLSLKISALVMVIAFLGIGILSYISYQKSKEIFINHTAQMVSKNIDQYTKFIESQINKLIYNITIFSLNPSIKGFMRAYHDPYKYDETTNKTFSQYYLDISQIILLMMKQNPSYFQIRILDANNGDEIIKFVRENNNIKQISNDKLQNKKQMEYFKDAKKLNKNNIYISKINLNREFNSIEFPIKPTIRVAKLIYVNNYKAGIAVINANIKKLFKFDSLKTALSTTFIANKEGFYIYNPIEPQKEFGFEFGKDYKIFRDYPVIKDFFNSHKKTFSYIDPQTGTIYEARKIYLNKDRFIVIFNITKPDLFQTKAKEYQQTLLISILGISLIVTIFTAILVNILTKPIRKLTLIANKIAKDKKRIPIDVKTNDEIGELANSISIMIEALEESKKELKDFANKLEEEVKKKTKELREINENLQRKVEEKVKELREKDKALIQQSKMAAMGEMIGAIAHQWRQPLNSLAINLQLIEELIEDKDIDKKEIKDIVEKGMKAIQFMSNTIDDFRNFFRKDKVAVEFNIKDAIEKTINLQKAQLKNHNIDIKTNLKDFNIKGFKNEFMQAILNIISNAKDAINERRKKENIDKGIIEISNEVKENEVIIKIKDNGGGIPKNILDRIFEPYFTTKEEGKGTGMGLYMVKEIIERMNGKIDVNVNPPYTTFIIKLKVNNENK